MQGISQGWLLVRVIIWVGALLIGAYLGYLIAYYTSQGGMSALGAAFPLLLALLACGVFLLVALVAAVVPRRRGRGVATTSLVCCGMVVAGVALGRTATPVIGLEYHAPVYRQTAGTMSVSLIDTDDYDPKVESRATCRTLADSDRAGEITGLDLGTLAGKRLRLTVYPLGIDGTPHVEAFIDGGVLPEDVLQPVWSGAGRLSQASDDMRSGVVRFDRLILGSEPGIAAGAWPAQVSGEAIWSCERWPAARDR